MTTNNSNRNISKQLFNLDILLIYLLIIITIIIIIFYCLNWDTILLCESNNLVIDKLNKTVLVEVNYSQLFYLKPKHLGSFYGNTWYSYITKSDFSFLHTNYYNPNELPLGHWNIKYAYTHAGRILNYNLLEAWPTDAKIKLPIKIKYIKIIIKY